MLEGDKVSHRSLVEVRVANDVAQASGLAVASPQCGALIDAVSGGILLEPQVEIVQRHTYVAGLEVGANVSFEIAVLLNQVVQQRREGLLDAAKDKISGS